MAGLIGFVHNLWLTQYPPEIEKAPNALRIGLLGASWIGPLAVITPARSHPEVIVVAVAARDIERANAYAKKHGIEKVHEKYQDLLDDPSLDAVYIALPNSHHLEWALRSLRAGKHVLLEKPSVSNAAEARTLFAYHAAMPDTSESPRPVLLEAFHYRFHPAWHAFLAQLSPPDIETARTRFSMPRGFAGKGDIRWDYSLAGGVLMDMGTYNVFALRQIFGANPVVCVTAEARAPPPGYDQQCEEAFKAEYRFPNGGMGSLEADMSRRGRFGVPWVDVPWIQVIHRPVAVADGVDEDEVWEKKRTVTTWLWVGPQIWHSIDVVDEFIAKAKDGGEVLRTWTEKETKKAYTWDGRMGLEGQKLPGEPYWTTYRYMMEEFVNRIKGSGGSGVWVDGPDSVAQMEAIDQAYEKAGMHKRPTSSFT